MSENTKIEWADHSWSPWRGCTKVSPGCLHCYAETLSKRNPKVLGSWGKGAPRVLAKNWNEPVAWDRKATQRLTEWSNRWCGTMRAMFKPESIPDAIPSFRVFPSLCDWLDDEVPVEWLAQFLALIRDTPNLDWLLLSKRPENWGKRMRDVHVFTEGPDRIALAEWLDGTPPPNVWLGVSVEDQTRANERIPLLLEIPARLRWLSVEPLLGPVDLTRIDGDQSGSRSMCMVNSLTGRHTDMGRSCPDVPCIDWVVVGGESGPCARPCNVEWIRSVIYDCKTTGIPCFVKQLGSRPEVEAPSGGWVQPVPVRHRKGGDPAEWPDNLRVRKFPEANLVNTDLR